MSETTKSVTPRREFLKQTARLAAVSALAGVAIPHVHAGEDNTIRLALIGCGGRGSGAVANAMSAGGLVMDNSVRPQRRRKRLVHRAGQAGGHGRPLPGSAGAGAQQP